MVSNRKPQTPYIQLFGGEGAGKTSHVNRLKEFLENQEQPSQALFTREPGATPLGSRIRDIVTVEEDLDNASRALLFFTDKVEHAARLVRPALDAGQPVIQDRGVVDTIVYGLQAVGMEADEPLYWQLINRYLEFPTMAILLDVTPEIGLSRKSKTETKYYEKLGVEFSARIIRLYEQFWKDATAGWFGRPQLKGIPGFVEAVRKLGNTRWVRVDADRTEVEVFNDVSTTVLQHLQEYEANMEEWNRTQAPEALVGTK